ncbi:alpha/beta hydrolase [Rheinheimera baltica]|uniref:Alpha/beta fold hydrolase n=1 Tax=Rheinheimera baltica TaxID=67576 RepID=A0ABT9I247_9GAMM|nr:alpha/beta fold hydrolase [Rheinheimera baltica]MDP5137432.1 alpha/beta fold hydrolase [Rheinheimera baltica]MDP5144740.1 alpha/beta fold hydrolase [Rheinheimera baltica]MDP5151973.1 alpha/beta fold hydrolase [Rheinheimera baltica]MDP5190161.1 alpha/beta fold hydrolase [Rheinheimera baltica]
MALLPFVDVKAQGDTRAVVVWLHGLGDSGHGFSPIVPELRLPADAGIRFLFPHAPERPVTVNGGMRMRAWYDIKTMELTSRADEEGVRESAAAVQQLLDKLISDGISSERIILAGFSQGGVIALHLLARLPYKLAGVMALSTYMCAPEKIKEEANSVNKSTPVLVAHGSQDPVVPLFAGQQAYHVLKNAGFNPSWHEYKMPHSVCAQEVADISSFIQRRLLIQAES